MGFPAPEHFKTFLKFLMSTRHSTGETERLGPGQGVSKGKHSWQSRDVMLGPGVSWSANSGHTGRTPLQADVHVPIMTLAWPSHLSHSGDLIPTLHLAIWWHHRLHTASNKCYVNWLPRSEITKVDQNSTLFLAHFFPAIKETTFNQKEHCGRSRRVGETSCPAVLGMN